MSRRLSLAAGAAVCVLSVALSGCGGGSSAHAGSQSGSTQQGSGTVSKAALDSYAAKAEQGVKAALSGPYRKIYSSIRVEPAYPDGIRFVYTFTHTVSPSVASQNIGKQASALKTAFTTEVAPELKQLGVAHPSVTWKYLNPDGSVVWQHTYS